MGNSQQKIAPQRLGDGGELPEGTCLSFQNVKCEVKGKTILGGISAYCRPGQTLAILGPSGAGKTSLLDIVAHRKTFGDFKGDIRLHGRPLGPSFRRVSGYVTSDDLLTSELTVLETLQFAAELRLPGHCSAQERAERVQEVMDQLHLIDIADQQVGCVLKRGISTGERKRLAIAAELLMPVEVLFLDEPTTGLDSHISITIMALIEEVCRKRNMSLITTIHAPSYQVLQGFDSLLLLANGRTCYFGTAPNAIEYFNAMGGQFKVPEKCNPTEHYLDLLAVHPDELADAYETSSNSAETVKKFVDISHRRGSIFAKFEQPSHPGDEIVSRNALVQIRELMKRSFKIYTRNKSMLLSRVISTLVIGVILGLCVLDTGDETMYNWDLRAVFYMILTFVPSIFSLVLIPHIILGRKGYYQELNSGYYNRWVYFLFTLTFEFCLIGGLSLIATLIAKGMSNTPVPYDIFVGMTLLASLYSTTNSIFCAMAAASVPEAIAFWGLFFTWNLIFNGYFLTQTHLAQICENCEKFFPFTSMQRMYIFVMYANDMGSPGDDGLPRVLDCLEDEKFSIELSQLVADIAGDFKKDSEETIFKYQSEKPIIDNALNNDVIFDLGGAYHVVNQAYENAIELEQDPSFGYNYSDDIKGVRDELATTITLITGAPANVFTNTVLPRLLTASVWHSIQGVFLASLAVGAPLLPKFSACWFNNGAEYLNSFYGFTRKGVPQLSDEDYMCAAPGSTSDPYGFEPNPLNAIPQPTVTTFVELDQSKHAALLVVNAVFWAICAFVCLRFCRFQKK